MRLLFGGDFLYKDGTIPSITNVDIVSAIKSADEFIINLEGPIITGYTKPIQKIGPNIYQSPDVASILKNLEVTGVTLANNHIMDYGSVGVEQTVESLKNYNISYFGLDGGNKNIGSVYRTRIDEQIISMISLAEEEFNSIAEFNDTGASIIDPIKIWYCISEELQKSDKIIVILHGGVEHEHCPPPWLRKLAHWLIDIGVSAIITHHPHVPGNVEIYKEAPIAWSLGNLWFSDGGGNGTWNQLGYVFELYDTLEGDLSWNVISYNLNYKKGEICKLNDDNIDLWNKLQIDLDNKFYNEKEYNGWWQDIINKKHMSYQSKYSFAPMPFLIKYTTSRVLQHFKDNHQWKLRQLNGLRCETHKNIWIASLMKGRQK